MKLNATILGQAVAFIIFVLFCMKYVWPPLMNAIEKRQKEIFDSLASAELAKKNLNNAHAEAANILKKVKLEAQTIIEQANKRKTQIICEAKVEAEAERSRILMQTQIDIETKYKHTNEKLQKHITMLALTAAKKIIGSSVNKAINNDIIEEIIAKL